VHFAVCILLFAENLLWRNFYTNVMVGDGLGVGLKSGQFSGGYKWISTGFSCRQASPAKPEYTSSGVNPPGGQ
jgi:hypothetical protein